MSYEGILLFSKVLKTRLLLDCMIEKNWIAPVKVIDKLVLSGQDASSSQG